MHYDDKERHVGHKFNWEMRMDLSTPCKWPSIDVNGKNKFNKSDPKGSDSSEWKT